MILEKIKEIHVKVTKLRAKMCNSIISDDLKKEFDDLTEKIKGEETRMTDLLPERPLRKIKEDENNVLGKRVNIQTDDSMLILNNNFADHHTYKNDIISDNQTKNENTSLLEKRQPRSNKRKQKNIRKDK